MTTLRRYVRQIIAPNGKHRPRPVLLPDEPVPAPAVPARGTVLTEAQILQLFDDGEAEVLTGAHCPSCNHTTPHAPGAGKRRCWECGTESPVEAS
ncbi:hypothetical protein [Streptomyces scabiei]|uniref:hypothetical protein n=1 Tax=Streptomyces scabiei TaxID=1930 RepID=UPI0029A58A4C|nr:hypothetical protein [Streptomyces scabiei]MDX3520768.1 hypothetical protein [Streptomyces scabiei]